MMRILSVLFVFLFSSWSGKLFAGDYHVEIIVFKNMNEYIAQDSRNYSPPAEIPSFASHWEATEYKLEEHIKKLEESENYQILLHHAWQQESLPYSESAAVEFVLDPEIHNQFAIPATDEEEINEPELKPAMPVINNITEPSIEGDVENSEEEIENEPVVNQAISGWVKIFAKTLLFAQFYLDYFGYRIKEKRRM